jgi:hypothetical protein
MVSCDWSLLFSLIYILLSGGAEFESQSAQPLSNGFPQFLEASTGKYLRLGHEHFFPHPYNPAWTICPTEYLVPSPKTASKSLLMGG